MKYKVHTIYNDDLETEINRISNEDNAVLHSVTFAGKVENENHKYYDNMIFVCVFQERENVHKGFVQRRIK